MPIEKPPQRNNPKAWGLVTSPDKKLNQSRATATIERQSSGPPGADLDLFVGRMLRPLVQAQQVQSQQIAQMAGVTRKLQHLYEQQQETL